MKCSEARKIISGLNILNLKDAKYDEIKEKIDALLIAGARIEIIVTIPGTRIFRGVIHQSKPQTSGLLGYPPAELVTSFQRCNAPSQPMFYCSPEPGVIFYELRVKPGDIVYFSKWAITKPFWITQIFGKYEINEADPITELVTSYFETLFSQIIHETFSYQYKTTAAVSELLSRGEIVSNEHKIGAVLYPSIAHSTRAQSLAIRPEIVDECLRLDYVKEFIVKKVDGQKIQLDTLDFANRFDDGKIHWTGRLPKWEVKPGEQVSVKKMHYGIELIDEKGNFIDPV